MPERVTYRIRVRLQDVKPLVERVLEVPDCTLTDLHDVLQTAMGWESYHMWSFETKSERWCEDAGLLPDGFDEARTTTLGELVVGNRLVKKKMLCYLYDFGDNWEHLITVERSAPAGKVDVARCIDGTGACPPEDCGGSYGYMDLCDALADKTHERHADARVILGARFKATRFDRKAVNSRLARLRLPAPNAVAARPAPKSAALKALAPDAVPVDAATMPVVPTAPAKAPKRAAKKSAKKTPRPT